jgi:hypothetical protein
VARRTTLEIIQSFIESQRRPVYDVDFGFILDR